MNAVDKTCATFVGTAGLNIASNGLMLTSSPFNTSKPCGYMKTSEGATTSGNVDLMIVLFAGLYVILGIGTVVVLTRMYKRNPVEDELAMRESNKGGEEE